MDKNKKISTVIGVILYAFAAVFSVSLLLVLFEFGGVEAVGSTTLCKFGKIFTRAYGICSVLIPVFLVIAAFECFMRKWHVKHGVVLAGSAIPFFTLDAIEHVCRMIIQENTGDSLVMKLTATFLTGGIIIALEYLVLSILGDAIEFADKREKKTKKQDPIPYRLEVSKAENEEIEKVENREDRIETDSFKADDIEENLSDENNPFSHIFDEQDKLAQEQMSLGETKEVTGKDSEPEHTAEDAEPDVFGEAPSETSDIENRNEDSAEDYGVQEPVLDENEPIEEESDNQLPEPEFAQENDEPEPEEIPLSEEDFDLPDLTDEFTDSDDFANNEVTELQPPIKESPVHQDDEAYSDYTQEQEVPFDGFDFPKEEEIDNAIETDESDTEGTSSMLSLSEYHEESDLDDNLESVKNYFSDDTDVEKDDNDDSEIVDDGIDGADDFGDDTIDFEDKNRHDDISDFVEERNNSFASIFAQMDKDAAENPVESDEAGDDNDFDDIFNTKEDDKDIPNELDADPSVKSPYDDFEFDPSADPVVDSNGLPFGPAIPFNISENSFDEVAKAKKNAEPLSFAEKAKFLQDSANESTGKSSALNANEETVSTNSKIEAHSSSALSSNTQNVEKKNKPKLRLSNYKIPVEGILQKYDNGEYWLIDDETKEKAAELKQTLSEFNIDVDVTGIRKGPVVTMFEVLPAPGVNVNRIRTLQDNIALRLAATSVRIVSPIPGKSAVGIEIPNKKRAVVSFREIIEQQNPAFEKMAIPVILGKDISGEPRVIDLTKTPHLLIAGSTGSGKSVCVNSLILSILYKRAPNQVKLILIDPKVVELKLYNDIPHLLTPVITEPKKALQALQYCLCEMERRYALLDNMGVRDISSYNRRITERKLMQEKIPYIVIIIDEFADLMATTGKELESNVARLAAMSRAVGIHLVLATQRPSVNVITGLIKANIPSRIAFMVASRTDSNIIIDQIGAEKLLGKGDMLYASATDPFPVRIQGTLVGDDEVEKVVDYVKQYGEPDYIDDEIFVDDDDEDSDGNIGLFGDGEDPLYDRALEIVVQSGKASASYLQRRLKIGYNRAARLVEEMEERGIVGPQNGSKPREVIHVP